MPNYLDEMASKAGEILRPNRFRMKLFFPTIIGAQQASDLSEFFVLSSEAPAKTLGILEVPVTGGHVYKVPGDTVVPDWNCTMILDSNMTIYKALMRWQEFCNSLQSGLRANDLSLYGSAELSQLDGINQVVQTWELLKIFPTEVSPITYSKESRDELGQTDVSFAINDIVTNLT